MTNKLYSIILPGFSYKADGPVWVDKIKISATLNNIPINIYDISTVTEAVTIAKLKTLTAVSEIEITSFKTFKQDDTFIIQNSASSDLNTFSNESNSGHGLCAVEFTGNYTDVILFTIDLYTNSNWTIKSGNTAQVDSKEPKYVHLKTIKLKYNPFITFTLPPKITAPTFINAVDISFAPKVDGVPSELKVTGSKNVLLDQGISLNPNYDNLPEVPIAVGQQKNCLKKLSTNTLLDTLDQKLNCDKYHLLLFNNDLPSKFGNNSQSYDQLAISAYRKSISGTTGRQRYTIVGVSCDNLPISNVSWTKSIDYDLTDFVKSVKYYSAQQFSVGIQATLSNSTIQIKCPTDLYTVSGNTYILQSGCMWNPIVYANKMSKDCFWDVWSDYSTLEPFVWTHKDNRGESFPTTVRTPGVQPKLVGTTSSTISSQSTNLKNSMNLDVIVDSLTGVDYLTFIDTSYGKKKFSDLVRATNQLAHSVENGYIQVVHAQTTLTPNLTIGISTNVSNVPTTSNYSLCPYVELTASDKQGIVFSYPVVDSADGGMQVTEITEVKDDAIVVYNSAGSTYNENPVYTPNQQCWDPNSNQESSKSTFYKLKANESLTITITDGGNYTIKYLQLPEDPAKLSENSQSLGMSFVSLNNGTVTIKNTFGYPVIVGSIGLVKAELDTLSDIGLKHSVGCYEDSKIFDNTFKCYYFPPDDTFCIGFYKVTENTTITKDSIVMLYGDTPQKNEIILNQLVGFQYKKASI